MTSWKFVKPKNMLDKFALCPLCDCRGQSKLAQKPTKL